MSRKLLLSISLVCLILVGLRFESLAQTMDVFCSPHISFRCNTNQWNVKIDKTPNAYQKKQTFSCKAVNDVELQLMCFMLQGIDAQALSADTNSMMHLTRFMERQTSDTLDFDVHALQYHTNYSYAAVEYLSKEGTPVATGFACINVYKGKYLGAILLLQEVGGDRAQTQDSKKLHELFISVLDSLSYTL